jgi:Tol biopolymer transport system component
VPARTGDAPKQVTPGEEEQGIPSWSNDGAQLCFGDVPAAFGQPGGTEAIHIVDTHTGHVSDLPNSDGLWSPRWSPNGRYISALTIKGQQLELYDLEKKTWILTKAKHVSTPNWSRDSQYIYYDTEGKERLLERIRIRDGQVEEIGSLAGYPDLAPWWSGLTPDNMPLLLRNLGTPQIYSLDLQSQ